MLKGMQRLMVCRRRNTLFESPLGTELPLKTDKVCLYNDPPMSAPSLAAAGAAQLTMTFRGQAQGANAIFTLDSAASDVGFVASAWLQRAGVVYKSTPSANVQLADGKEAFCKGQVNLRIRIGALRDTVRCYVLDMAGFDIILGDGWLTSRRVHMDFGTKSAFVYKGKFRTTIRAVSHRMERARPVAGPLLSALQVKRLLRSTERSFLVQVTDSTVERYLASIQTPADGLVPPGRMQAILSDYKDVFEELPDKLPPPRNHAHVIPLEPGARPVFRPMYRLTPAEKAEVERQVTDLLRKGYIEPSHSPWGAPVLFVPKKDGGLRMCIDYRFLNKITVKNRYPLPRIEDLLEQLHGATVFSGLDLASGYWQIRIHDDDVDKTAFRTHLGHFQWRVLSFGLTNCPSTFQQVMNDVFRDCLGKFVVIYLDDILIYSKTAAEHEHHLRVVLQRLREHEFYCRPHKCHFNQSEIQYLGHIVGREGVKVDPRKIQAVAEWPVPQDQHQVRSFLGLANYFRRFVQGYSGLVQPLTDLLRAGVDVAKGWNPTTQQAFEGVKHALTHAPVLVLPDFAAAQKDKPFEVIADASLTGVGAVLLQDGRPIAFESKKFSSAERNYDTSQRELLATIHALRVWRCCLEGLPFTLVTDHHPNTAFETQKELSPRMARWYEFLTRFSHMRWEYRPGRVNVADPLTRMPRLAAITTRFGGRKTPPTTRFAPADVAGQAAAFEQLAKSHKAEEEAVKALLPKGQKPRKRQKTAEAEQPTVLQPESPASPAPAEVPRVTPDPRVTDDVLSKMVQQIQAGYKQDAWFAKPANTKSLQHREGLYWRVLQDGTEVLVVPDAAGLRKQCVQECHDAPYMGHVGMHKTFRLLERLFWWPHMRADAERFVRTCVPCQRNKSSTQAPAGLLQPLPIPGRRWETVTMDLITKLPVTPTGCDAIMVFVDKLTKMVHLVACKEADGALELANYFVTHVFRLHGVPRTLLSDRDPRFTSNLYKEIARLLHVKQAMSSAFHPQTDGQTERVNRVVEEMLRHYVNPQQNDWDAYLPVLEFAINNSYQESVGTTPFYLNYGQHPLMPQFAKLQTAVPAALQFTVGMQAALQKAKLLLQGAQDRQKALANAGRRDVSYTPDDMVWLNTKHLSFKNPGARKLLPRYVGPFKVIERIGEVAYRLKLPAKLRIHDVFHVSLLRPYRSDGRYPAMPEVVDLAGDFAYQVETIVAHRGRRVGRRGRQHTVTDYLVKYVDLGHEYNAWVPEKQLLRDCPAVVQQYGAVSAR